MLAVFVIIQQVQVKLLVLSSRHILLILRLLPIHLILREPAICRIRPTLIHRPLPVLPVSGGIIQGILANRVHQLILHIQHILHIVAIAEIMSAVQTKHHLVVLQIVEEEQPIHPIQPLPTLTLHRQHVHQLSIGTVLLA